MRSGLFCAILALVLGIGPALVQDSAASERKSKRAVAAKSNKSKVARHKAPQPVLATAASAKAAPALVPRVSDGPMTTAEQLAIQSALIWSGDYTGSVAGDDPLIAAVKAFQKRSRSKITGMLSPAERTTLETAAKNHEQEFGWTVVVDPATGIRIGLPTKMVPHAREAKNGTRWSSTHGEVQVETFRVKDSAESLSAIFERLKKEPQTRKVENSVLRADSFFISGLQGLKIFSVRAQAKDGEVRGFTMLYDQAMEGIVAPAMVAMASAFAPFPAPGAPIALMPKNVEYATGLVVSAQGHIVADRRATDGCQFIVAPGLGNAERLAEDRGSGLALLRIYGAHNLSPAWLGGEAPAAGEFTLVGVPDPQAQDGERSPTGVKARLAPGGTIELARSAPMAGFAGGAALDAQGRLIGMLTIRNTVVASAGPAAPLPMLVSAEHIRDFLAEHQVGPAGAAADSDAKAAVVRVICVRK